MRRPHRFLNEDSIDLIPQKWKEIKKEFIKICKNNGLKPQKYENFKAYPENGSFVLTKAFLLQSSNFDLTIYIIGGFSDSKGYDISSIEFDQSYLTIEMIFKLSEIIKYIKKDIKNI